MEPLTSVLSVLVPVYNEEETVASVNSGKSWSWGRC